VELGISGDFISSYRFGYPDSISSSTANPVVGLNYEIDKSNTLRFAYQGYVSAHSSFNSSIAPSEVAGFPSMINVAGFDGSKVKELGFAWESQWNPLTFTVFRLTAYRIDDPQFVENPNMIDWRIEHFDGSFTVNRLLTSSLGLSAGVAEKIVSMAAPIGAPSEIFATGNFNEISGNAALSYMHPSGWFASIKNTVVHQHLGGLSDPYDTSLVQHQKELGDPFNLVDITFGKYFANKRGYAQLAITNVFNQHFCYETEEIALDQFYPDREIIFRVGLYF
jgi:hypothetical protein